MVGNAVAASPPKPPSAQGAPAAGHGTAAGLPSAATAASIDSQGAASASSSARLWTVRNASGAACAQAACFFSDGGGSE